MPHLEREEEVAETDHDDGLAVHLGPGEGEEAWVQGVLTSGKHQAAAPPPA